MATSLAAELESILGAQCTSTDQGAPTGRRLSPRTRMRRRSTVHGLASISEASEEAEEPEPEAGRRDRSCTNEVAKLIRGRGRGMGARGAASAPGTPCRGRGRGRARAGEERRVEDGRAAGMVSPSLPPT